MFCSPRSIHFICITFSLSSIQRVDAKFEKPFPSGWGSCTDHRVHFLKSLEDDTEVIVLKYLSDIFTPLPLFTLLLQSTLWRVCSTPSTCWVHPAGAVQETVPLVSEPFEVRSQLGRLGMLGMSGDVSSRGFYIWDTTRWQNSLRSQRAGENAPC